MPYLLRREHAVYAIAIAVVSVALLVVGGDEPVAHAAPGPAAQTGSTAPTGPAAPTAAGPTGPTGPTGATGPAGSAGQAAGTGATAICRSVPIGSTAIDFTGLNGVQGISLNKIGDRTLMICGAPSLVDTFQDLVQKLSDYPVADSSHNSHVVRLFYNRNASDIANAINASAGLATPVKPLGDDLLIFPAESRADDHAISELKRWIAMIDVPRPEVSLAAWSIQISSTKPDVVDKEAENIRQFVSRFNQQLHNAIQNGWQYLEGRRTGSPMFLDQDFQAYLSDRYYGKGDHPDVKQACRSDEYCLGYSGILSPIQPSLTSMLIALSAASDPCTAIDGFVSSLESGAATLPCGTAKFGMDTADRKTNATSLNPEFRKLFVDESGCELDDQGLDALSGRIGFECFREQLRQSIGDRRSNALLRTALADFLFHYKASEMYPRDFVSWNRGASAQSLDNLFSPLIVEFNRDLNVYLRWLQFQVGKKQKQDKGTDFLEEGIVTVKVVSGLQAIVKTTTQSNFEMPPVVSATAFANALAGSTGSTGSSGLNVLSHNLTPLAAQAILAGVQSVQQKTAQIGRSLNLIVTANTLSGASSAELDVELDSSDSATPSYVDQNGASSNDNLNHIATHNVQTRVRVDSLKLFEISSFSATLSHGRSIPLIPPLVDLPILGSLARLRLPPGTVYHRSIAVVSAVIVPTAADIANAIEFRDDVEVGHLSRAFITKAAAPNYYAVVAHFPGGASGATGTTSVSAPVALAGSGRVAVSWSQPAGATSFDLYRGSDPTTLLPGTTCTNCAVATGIAGTSYVDPGTPVSAGGTIPAPTTGAVPSRISAPAPSTNYYVVVSHFKDGTSVSAPSAQSGNLPVSLSWERPVGALSFDIYRSSDNTVLKPGMCANCLVAGEIQETNFVDTVASTSSGAIPKEEPLVLHSIGTMPRNILDFHRYKIACLGPSGTVCKDVKLSTTPLQQ